MVDRFKEQIIDFILNRRQHSVDMMLLPNPLVLNEEQRKNIKDVLLNQIIKHDKQNQIFQNFDMSSYLQTGDEMTLTPPQFAAVPTLGVYDLLQLLKNGEITEQQAIEELELFDVKYLKDYRWLRSSEEGQIIINLPKPKE